MDKSVLECAEVRAVGGDDSRTLEFVGSTNSVDRMGDIVEQNFELKHIRKNPVFLFGHRYADLPIGKIVKITADKTAKGVARTLFQVKFISGDIYPFAEKVYQLYKAKLMNAVSIGFRPLKIDRNLSDEERNKMGLGRWGARFLKSELLELSAVTVPANGEALLRGVTKGLLTKDASERLAQMEPSIEMVREGLTAKSWAAIERELGEIEWVGEPDPDSTDSEERSQETPPADPEHSADAVTGSQVRALTRVLERVSDTNETLAAALGEGGLQARSAENTPEHETEAGNEPDDGDEAFDANSPVLEKALSALDVEI